MTGGRLGGPGAAQIAPKGGAMPASVLLDVTGRRRSPTATPGFLCGHAPHNFASAGAAPRALAEILLIPGGGWWALPAGDVTGGPGCSCSCASRSNRTQLPVPDRVRIAVSSCTAGESRSLRPGQDRAAAVDCIARRLGSVSPSGSLRLAPAQVLRDQFMSRPGRPRTRRSFTRGACCR